MNTLFVLTYSKLSTVTRTLNQMLRICCWDQKLGRRCDMMNVGFTSGAAKIHSKRRVGKKAFSL